MNLWIICSLNWMLFVNQLCLEMHCNFDRRSGKAIWFLDFIELSQAEGRGVQCIMLMQIMDQKGEMHLLTNEKNQWILINPKSENDWGQSGSRTGERRSKQFGLLNYFEELIYFIMNEDPTYDGYLLDLISLLQEAVIRALSRKPMDVRKFQHYFESLYDRMLLLERSFHSETKKITKHIGKLKKFLASEGETPRTREPAQSHQHVVDRPIEQPTVNTRATYKSVYGSRELKSIEEESEDNEMLRTNPGKRRSETANGYRQKLFENTRPMTGQMGKNRYKNKTIEVPSNPLTEQQERNTISVAYQESSQRDKRKEFYDQLERMKDNDEKGLSLATYNLPFRKKSRSQQKWTHKIGRLL